MPSHGTSRKGWPCQGPAVKGFDSKHANPVVGPPWSTAFAVDHRICSHEGMVTSLVDVQVQQRRTEPHSRHSALPHIWHVRRCENKVAVCLQSLGLRVPQCLALNFSFVASQPCRQSSNRQRCQQVHSVTASVSAFSLFGGTTVPDLHLPRLAAHAMSVFERCQPSTSSLKPSSAQGVMR